MLGALKRCGLPPAITPITSSVSVAHLAAAVRAELAAMRIGSQAIRAEAAERLRALREGRDQQLRLRHAEGPLREG